jgi:hypothetical protein
MGCNGDFGFVQGLFIVCPSHGVPVQVTRSLTRRAHRRGGFQHGCLPRFFILTGPGLASLAAVIFPKAVLKSLSTSDLLRPKIGFVLALSRHFGSSAEISALSSQPPLATICYFPPTSLSSPELPTAHCTPPIAHRPLSFQNRVRFAARFRK